MSLASELRELFEKRYVGPRESFDYVHIGLLIYWLGEDSPKSRSEISNFLGLGEGSTRTMLRRLKEKGMICITRDGVRLSDNGFIFFSKLKIFFPAIKEGSFGALSLGKYSVIVRVNKGKERVSRGIEQRDESIRYGAKGTITLVYEDSHFMFPGVGEEGCEALHPRAIWDKIRMLTNPKNGDIIIICSAESVQSAYLGCFSAALTLNL
jgi:DNA-binding Lrp family transcriptional regulator